MWGTVLYRASSYLCDITKLESPISRADIIVFVHFVIKLSKYDTLLHFLYTVDFVFRCEAILNLTFGDSTR